MAFGSFGDMQVSNGDISSLRMLKRNSGSRSCGNYGWNMNEEYREV